MFAAIKSAVCNGITSSPVSVECDLGRGLAVFTLVGLASNGVAEARIRARSALVNSGYTFPMRRVTVNLAPADLRKSGCHLDLPIALAILCADEQVPLPPFEHTLVLGELGLDGSIRSVRGVLPMALHASRLGIQTIIAPTDSANEASAVDNLTVLSASHLTEVVEWAHQRQPLSAIEFSEDDSAETIPEVDMADVFGQLEARRAMEIAAAGGHNLLLSGPPGCGKSMLAKRMPTIVPPMSLEERLETTAVASVAGELGHRTGLISKRPFRAPHQSASAVALTGGGSMATPGEVSLAHNGVLFLDEFPEFTRPSLEALRQPLEDGVISISRAGRRATYPARFILVAAMNPCPCGYVDHPRRACDCHPDAIRRYRKRISGPILDRIDLHLRVKAEKISRLKNTSCENSKQIRERVLVARRAQDRRFESTSLHCNAHMDPKTLRRFCALQPESLDFLECADTKFGFSRRCHDRILRVARTIADLDLAESIKRNHLAEAIHYRMPSLKAF